MTPVKRYGRVIYTLVSSTVWGSQRALQTVTESVAELGLDAQESPNFQPHARSLGPIPLSI